MRTFMLTVAVVANLAAAVVGQAVPPPRVTPDGRVVVYAADGSSVTLFGLYAPPPAPTTPARANRVAVDAAWLAAAGPPPWVLDRPDTLYVLATDLDAPGTALVVGAGGLTLDLSGHIVTYNDAAPLGAVPNGDFEADPLGTTAVTDWDTAGLAGAVAAVVDAAHCGLFGAKALALTWNPDAMPDARPTLVSGPIAIPEAGRTYTAAVSASCLDSDRGCDVLVEVLTTDPRTDPTAARPPVWRLYQGAGGFGEGGFFKFVAPAGLATIWLRVTLIHGSGSGPITCTLDRALVTRSDDFGVLAGAVDANGLAAENGFTDQHAPGGPAGYPTALANLGDRARAAYQQARDVVITDSTGAGAIVQGRAAGHHCPPVFAVGSRGTLEVSGLTLTADGDDAQGIVANQAGGDGFAAADVRTIKGNTVKFVGTRNVTARGNLYCAINVVNGGPATVTGNTVLDNPQVGIKAGSTAVDPATGQAFAQTVADNTLRPDTTITNGYGIVLAGSNLTCSGNTIAAGPDKSARGIDVQIIGGGRNYAGIAVVKNTVDVYERRNREYGGLAGSRAFRMRNLAESNIGLRDVAVTDNTFIAHATAAGQREAFGVRVTMGAPGPAQEGADLTFAGNTCRATKGDGDAAYGLSVDQADPRVGITWTGDRFESDDCAVRLGGPDGTSAETIADLTFSGVTLARLGSAPAYRGVVLGYGSEALARIVFAGTVRAPDTPDLWTRDGTGAKDVTVH